MNVLSSQTGILNEVTGNKSGPVAICNGEGTTTPATVEDPRRFTRPVPRGAMADAIRGRGRGERLDGDCPGTPRCVGGTGGLTALLSTHH